MFSDPDAQGTEVMAKEERQEGAVYDAHGNIIIGAKVKVSLMGRLRGYFLAGVLVTAPLAITAAVAWWLIDFVDSQVVPLIPSQLNPDTYMKEVLGLEIGLPGLGLIVLFVGITLIGALTAGLVGRWIVRFWESLLNRMPVVRSVYAAVKQILETVLKQQSKAFQKAVLVEYPRRGLWAIAFVTSDTKGEVEAKTPGDHVNVFLPTTPNPTSGFLLFVPVSEAIPLDMTVEDAVKMVISGGIVTPEMRQSSLPKRDEPAAGWGIVREDAADETVSSEESAKQKLLDGSGKAGES